MKDMIERKNKTVPWCPSCQTVLASAEIEYEERKDPSIYVEFPLVQNNTDQLFPALKGKQSVCLSGQQHHGPCRLTVQLLLKPNEQYVVLRY